METLRKNIEELLEKLKDVCAEEEIEDLEAEINECIEEEIDINSLLYLLSRLASTNLVKKAKQLGYPVSEIFMDLIVHTNESSNCKIAGYEAEIDGIYYEEERNLDNSSYLEKEAETKLILNDQDDSCSYERILK